MKNIWSYSEIPIHQKFWGFGSYLPKLFSEKTASLLTQKRLAQFKAYLLTQRRLMNRTWTYLYFGETHFLHPFLAIFH